MHVMENPTHSAHSPQQEVSEAPLVSSSLTISLSFKNGQIKTLERFLTARNRFETPDAERAELHRVFQHFDADGDGNLSEKEIRNSLEKLGIVISAADVGSLVSFYAENNGHAGDDALLQPPGYLDFTDFCRLYKSLCQEENEEDFVCTRNGNILEADLRSAFDLFDKNHDNFISVTELQSVLLSLGFKEANDLNQCRSMIAPVDSDGDGMVNFDEFKAMMENMNE